MAEHFTKNTLECTSYCPQCQRQTQHRVDGGRKGPCIDPKHPIRKETQKQEKRRRDEERRRINPELPF